MLKKFTSLLLALVMISSLFASPAFAAQLPGSVQPLLDRLDAIFDNLNDGEREAIEQAQFKLKSMSEADRLSITKPAWDKLLAAGADASQISEESVNALFLAVLSIQYGDVENALLDVYENHIGTIEQLVALSDSSGLDTVSFQDLVDLVGQLEDAFLIQLRNLSFSSLIENGINQTFNNVFSKAYGQVLMSNNPLAAVFSDLRIDQSVLIQMKDNMTEAVDQDHAAAFALALSYIRSEASLAENSANNSLTPQLTIFGRTIPNEFLSWTIVEQVSGPSIKVSGDEFTLSGTGTGTATIAATLSVLGHLVYQGNITLTANSTPPGGGGGGGGGGAPTPGASSPGETVPELEEIDPDIDLNDDPAVVADKVNRAVEDIINLTRKAQVDAQQAVKEAANVQVSTIVADGVAKAQLDVDDLLNKIGALKDQVNKHRDELAKLQNAANEKLAQLREAAGDLLGEPIDEVELDLELEFVIDLGTVDAEQTETEINQSIVSALQDAGVNKLMIVVNGVRISVPMNALSGDVTVSISKLASALGRQDVSIAAMQAVPISKQYVTTTTITDEYELSITSGGVALQQFDAAVTVSIPIADADNYDTELLTLVSIGESGEQKYITGRYNAETGNVEADVYNLTSPYAVVETVVAYDDLSSVQTWAGRAIEVASAKGIINGKALGVFDPEAPVSRAEFAKMIVLAFNLFDEQATESFTDVNEEDWFHPYVASAVQHGLVNGRGGDLFDPHASISRAEMATIAARALQTVEGVKAVSDVDSVLKRYADADQIAGSLRAGTALATRLGIVIGSNGAFDPTGDSSRAAAAVVIYRLINLD